MPTISGGSIGAIVAGVAFLGGVARVLVLV